MSEYLQECRSCLWWVDQSQGVGECHRYAPRPVTEWQSVNIAWPRTAIDHGCGDHSGYPR